MKKSVLAISALATILMLGSCEPKKSAYRQVIEQAKQREVAHYQGDASSSSMIVSKPSSTDASFRREKVSAVQGEDASRLKHFCVVVGSFSNHTNARSLKERLEDQGYKPVLAQNEQGMLRVIITSFGSKAEAAQSRDEIKAVFAPQFSDAWLLETTR